MSTSSNIALVELMPSIALIDPKDLPKIPIKNIPGIVSDKEAEYEKGRKIHKAWYTSKENRTAGKKAFCKEYEYSVENSELTKTTYCKWFDAYGELFHTETFEQTYSVAVSDYKLQEFRKINVSRLESGAKGTPIENAVTAIYKHFKDSIQNYIEFQSEAQNWVDQMNTTPAVISDGNGGQTDNPIYIALNTALPVLEDDNGEYLRRLTLQEIGALTAPPKTRPIKFFISKSITQS